MNELVYSTWAPWECAEPNNLYTLLRSIHLTYLYYLPTTFHYNRNGPLVFHVHGALRIFLEKLNLPSNIALPTTLSDCRLFFYKLLPSLRLLQSENLEVKAAYMALCLHDLTVAQQIPANVDPEQFVMKVKAILKITNFVDYFQKKVRELQNVPCQRNEHLTYVPYHYWFENFNLTDSTQEKVMKHLEKLADQSRLPLKSIKNCAEISTVPDDDNEYSICIINL